MAKNGAHTHIICGHIFLAIFWPFLDHILVTFEGKMDKAKAPSGLGPQSPTKELAHWVELFGLPLSRNHVFEIFSGEPPS